MEILLSSVSARRLLTGKVLGLGAGSEYDPADDIYRRCASAGG